MLPANLDDLIDIFSFVTWMFYGLTTGALIIMRFTMKDAHREFKVGCEATLRFYLMLVKKQNDSFLRFLSFLHSLY